MRPWTDADRPGTGNLVHLRTATTATGAWLPRNTGNRRRASCQSTRTPPNVAGCLRVVEG